MNGAMRKLFFIEVRRQWTIAAMFIPLGIGVLGLLFPMIAARTQNTYDIARQASSINLTLVVPLAVCLFCAGGVANDVRDGWLRTLLIRPVSRQKYLLVKGAAICCSVIVTIVIAGVLPNLVIAAFFAKGRVVFDLVPVFVVHAMALLQAFLFVAILMFFSCWLPGIFNVVLFVMWALVASLLGGYIQFVHWSDKWLTLLRDYLFPSGFSDAVDVVLGERGVPAAELAWGFAALCAFLALAFWSITKIQVDKSSE